MPEKRFRVVGARFSGAVVARELALHTDRKIVVFDERDHVAGNCHAARDESTGVMGHTARSTFSLQVVGVIVEALDFAADFLKSYASKSKTLPRFTQALAEQIRQQRV